LPQIFINARRVHAEFQIDPWQSCRIDDMGDVPLPEANNKEPFDLRMGIPGKFRIAALDRRTGIDST